MNYLHINLLINCPDLLEIHTIAKPQAVFTYNNRSILIKLKSRYLKELKSVIDQGVKNYGLEDEGYWNLIRQTSIKYWLEWDRNKIFDLTIL